MSAYEAVSDESLTATPPTSPAPQIVNGAANAAADLQDPTKLIIQALANLLGNIGNMAMQSLGWAAREASSTSCSAWALRS